MALFGKKFTCAACGMKFGSEAEFKEHSKMHMSAAKPSSTFTCAACGMTFNSSEEMRAHGRQAHKM
jgi:transcription elongation factor Elf1